MKRVRPIAFGLVLAGAIVLTIPIVQRFRLRQHRVSTSSPAVSAGQPAGPVMSVEAASYSAGRWYLVDARSHQLHLLDSLGQHVKSVGRRGRGPGEFLAPSVVAASATRVYVAELGRPAITEFDTSGAFRRHLQPAGSCPAGGVAGMTASEADLFVWRRCLELPARVRYQLERSHAGSELVVWAHVADTLPVLERDRIPLQHPVIASDAGRIVVGDGGTGCLRIFRAADGRDLGQRCLSEVDRQRLSPATRSRMEARWRGRIAVPDSLPRFVALSLRDTSFVVYAVDDTISGTWREFSWRPAPGSRGRTVGKGATALSFLGPTAQLIVHDGTDGTRIEVVRIER